MQQYETPRLRDDKTENKKKNFSNNDFPIKIIDREIHVILRIRSNQLQTTLMSTLQ